MTMKILSKNTKSLRFGVVGTGQAGSRLAETFAKLGYEAVALNTAPQDLEHIQLPDDRKLLLDYGLGGAAKDTEIGKAAAEEHRDLINELLHDKLSNSQVSLLCLSLGGGSGAGSCETLIDLLSNLGRPIIVITVLPMTGDDALTKENALKTLSLLTKELQVGRVHNLVTVDNARIESMYANVSQMSFFEKSNEAIVAPLDALNVLSSMSSPNKPLDNTEFAKIMTDGGGLSVYGEMFVEDYTSETSIGDAITQGLKNGLLASGFDLKQAKYAGFMIVANKDVWENLTATHMQSALGSVEDICGTPGGVFHGSYVTDMKQDGVKVYSIFSGLGLPEDRVEQLKKDVMEAKEKVKAKEETRSSALKLNIGVEDTIAVANQRKKNIAASKSGFGSLFASSVNKKK